MSIKGIIYKDRQCCIRDERILIFFRDGLSIGRRSASPVKPPQGAYFSRVGTERCGNDFGFDRGNSMSVQQRTKDEVRYGLRR